MNIQTERLELVALTPTQLKWWLNDCHRLECELNCLYCAEPMEGLFRRIAAGQLAAAERAPGHYVWHSFWFLIRKSDRAVVGSADFKGLPDSGGLVETGLDGFASQKLLQRCGFTGWKRGETLWWIL